MAHHLDRYSAVANEIMGSLWDVMPLDEAKLGEALHGFCQKADKLRREGQWDGAVKWCETGQQIVRELRDSVDTVMFRFAEGFIFMQLGAIDLSRRELEQAVKHFGEAIARFQSCNRFRSQSVGLMAVGEAHLLAEDWEKAISKFQRSLNTLNVVRATDHTTTELRRHVVRKLEQAQAVPAGTVTKHTFEGARASSSPRHGWRRIPIVGTIAAGAGLIAEEEIEGYLLLSQERAHSANFAVRVRGQSMVEAGILECDFALIREQPVVDRGNIAAVVIASEGQVEGTLKCYYREGNHHRLEPCNASEPTLVVIPAQGDLDEITRSYCRQGKRIETCIGEVQVLGKLVGIFREVD